MLIPFRFGQEETTGGQVWLTDDPAQARMLWTHEPVIGIIGPGSEYHLWSGILYLAESPEAVTPDYAARVWCRFYHEPVVIAQKTAEGEGWKLREMTKQDLPLLDRLYRDPQVLRFLPHPLGEEQKSGENERMRVWEAWLDAYRELVYEREQPAMWTIADGEDRFLGRLGLEWRAGEDVSGDPDGYYLGYALLPEHRGKGLVVRAAQALFAYLEEEWEITKLWLKCRTDNTASVNCAERMGFSIQRRMDGGFLLMKR